MSLTITNLPRSFLVKTDHEISTMSFPNYVVIAFGISEIKWVSRFATHDLNI
jgi:hypothetical protein